jgi:assimilatory nitrate reductase catalytic subunit
MAETRTTCPYCGVGCGVIVQHDGGAITGVRGDPDHPANSGQLCSKGSTLHLTMRRSAAAARLVQPMARAQRGGALQPVAWDGVLDDLAQRFADCIAQHGPDSVAFYVSGQLLTEDYYVFNKLARGLVGTNNIDSNSRLCMSSAVAGYKSTLGADAPPACYEDVDHAGCIFIAGSNAAWAHPVLYRRIAAAKARNPDLKVVVVDPRRTATAAAADLHLAIEPGTDVALFHGMLHVLLWEDAIDRDFIAARTSGFDALRTLVREYTPRNVASLCGIDENDIVHAARWFAQGPTLSLYCQGLNQSSSGTAKNEALVNLHLATGQIGKPGAGPFSLTGQPNAMGGREVGGLANLLCAHRDLANAEHRAEIATLWGVDAIPAQPGLTAVELFDALADGRVRMVWIVCTNPAQSLPDQASVRAGLARAELVVLQEAYAATETAPFADVLLPAASWGEKEGTVTNSERRISRVRAAIAPPGVARADWSIAADFARRLEAHLRPGAPTIFPYTCAADVFAEHVRTTAGRDLDITALSHGELDARGPQQWPFPAGAAHGTARLYADGAFPTADGRARFAAAAFRGVAETINSRYPIRLTTGRLRDQWHGMTRTGTAHELYAHAPEPALDMHPADLNRRDIADGDLVSVESKRGKVIVPVRATTEVKPGAAFLPMHWGSHTLCGDASTGINAVSGRALCPVSRQPELKHAAVRVARAELPWKLVAFGYPLHEHDAEAMRARLRALLATFAFATVVLTGHQRGAVLVRAASASAPSPDLLAAIDACFALDAGDVARYEDPRRGIGRRLRVLDGRLAAVRLSGDVASEDWLREWLTEGRDVSALRSLLLLPADRPPAGFRARGRIVCQCFGTAENDIAACMQQSGSAGEAALAVAQAQLKCGTNCGSCVPELRMIADRVATSSPSATTMSTRRAAA